jgi:outer membrane protein OmpA-like peptidoglycan-associated protein
VVGNHPEEVWPGKIGLDPPEAPDKGKNGQQEDHARRYPEKVGLHWKEDLPASRPAGEFFFGGVFGLTPLGFPPMSRRGRMMEGETFAHRDAWGRWVVPALVLSILAHLAFWSWSRNFPVERMSDSFYEKIVPRTFQVERVEIDPRLLEPEPDETQQTKITPAAPTLPEENFSFEKMMAETPDSKNPPRLDRAILDEKPTLPDPVTTEAASKPARAFEAVKDAAEDLLSEMPAVASDPLATMPQPVPAIPTARAIPANPGEGRGFTDLDELLAKTGPLTPDTAPILLPGDLLFDYDTYKLQPGAVSSLQKLGQLLLRNPRSLFLIEGHSDSFGPDDYNLRLSELRAETVREWLISSMGIPAASIEIRGFGESRLIAPATSTIEEQQINRRVEIVIRDPSP